jgi:hypothetical protein
MAAAAPAAVNLQSLTSEDYKLRRAYYDSLRKMEGAAYLAKEAKKVL